MTEKPLFIPLKTEYYDAFASGKKTIERRKYGAGWNEQTCRVGRRVTLSKGYGKQNRLYGTIKAFYVSAAAAKSDEWIAVYGPGEAVAACIGIELDEVMQ